MAASETGSVSACCLQKIREPLLQLGAGDTEREIGINILTHGHGMDLTKEIFELIFPQGLFDWVAITDGRSDEQHGSLPLTEKDLPPLSNTHQTIVAKKFHDMTITDFPCGVNARS